MKDRLMRKVALVTAGTRGIGAAIARQLSAASYDVAVMSPSSDTRVISDEIGGIGVTGTVTEPSDIELLVETTLLKYGRIDAVVNNTGHAPTGEICDIDDASWLTGWNLILMSVIRLTRDVTPHMESIGGGAFVNVLTFGSKEPRPSHPVSAVYRTGLLAYSKIFSDQYASRKIRMNNILPGYISTGNIDPDVLKGIPTGRYGEAFEVADLAQFLLSDKAQYITGQSIVIDGGMTRGL